MGLIALGALIILLVQWAAVGGAATTVYFWLFSVVALSASTRVITHRQPVYSALYFVLTVLSTAGLFVLLWAEFLAAALVIIYAGAILVTYTFVIMLASEASGRGLVTSLADSGSRNEFEHDVESRSPVLACLAGFVVMGTMLFLIFDRAAGITSHGPIQPDTSRNVAGGLQQLGVYLFTHQAVALQLAGLILTLAMVGALMIARKRVLLSEEDNLTGEVPQTAPYTPVDDNPHSISVNGEVGPRAKRRDREMAEL
jgi:NADH-quinone oxidoreductase subunit J